MSPFPEKILLATDGSEDAIRATEAASDLARRSGSELHVVHVWHDVPGFAHKFVKAELRRQGQEKLDEQVRKIEDSGGRVTEAHLRGGRTSNEVISLSRKIGAGLLVVGSRGLGTVQRILMGSQSEEIVHHAQIPVLVMRGREAWPPQRIVIGEDFSDDARRAGDLAASIGSLYESEATLLFAHPDLPEVPDGEIRDAAARNLLDMRQRDETRLETRAGELEAILGRRPEIRVSDGYPAAVLLRAVQGEDHPSLVAVGSRGLAGMMRTRLGSVSTKVVTASRGPVLISPHAG